jgi:hypothetical protein
VVTANGKLYYGNESKIIQKITRKPVDAIISRRATQYLFLLTNEFIIYTTPIVYYTITQINFDPVSTMDISIPRPKIGYIHDMKNGQIVLGE